MIELLIKVNCDHQQQHLSDLHKEDDWTRTIRFKISEIMRNSGTWSMILKVRIYKACKNIYWSFRQNRVGHRYKMRIKRNTGAKAA